MLLNIKIYDSTDEDASKIIAAVTKALVDIRKGYAENKNSLGPYTEYTFEHEPPNSQPIHQVGSCINSTFVNYMNSTKKE